MKKNIFDILILLTAISSFTACGDVSPDQGYDVFAFTFSLRLPGPPEVIYDAITGDISGWWDHTFKTDYLELYIEPKPGGGFYEIWNEAGDGVQHARVIYADRGKMLRMDGPLGLSGKAFQLVSTYSFEAVDGDSTKLTLEVHASGEMDKTVPGIVEQVWRHFMFKRFKPYIESGQHLQ